MAEEAAGQSPAFFCPVWVAQTRCLHQEAQIPLCQLPSTRIRAWAAPWAHGAVLDNLCQSGAQPGAAGTGAVLQGTARPTETLGHTEPSAQHPRPGSLPTAVLTASFAETLLSPPLRVCSVFVFLRRCPSAAFRGPSRGTTSPEGPAALPDVSQAQPWDSFGATRPAGTAASRA